MKTLRLTVLTIALVLTPYTFAHAQFCGEFLLYTVKTIVNQKGDVISGHITPVLNQTEPCAQGDPPPPPLQTMLLTSDGFFNEGFRFTTINEPEFFQFTAQDSNVTLFCYSMYFGLSDCLLDVNFNGHPAFTPSQKNLARAKAFAFETVSGGAAVAAAACIVKLGFANPICLGLTSIASTFEGYARALKVIADDPPRDDFTEPCTVEVQTIDPLGQGRLRRQATNLTNNGLRIVGTLNAAICAAEKSAGAEIAGATDWQQWQADQAQAFLHDSAPMFGRAAVITQNITATLQARGENTSFLDGIPDSLIELQQGFAP